MLKCPKCSQKGLITSEVVFLDPNRNTQCDFCKTVFSLKKSNWIYWAVSFIIIIFIIPTDESSPIYVDLFVMIVLFALIVIIKVLVFKLHDIKNIKKN